MFNILCDIIQHPTDLHVSIGCSCKLVCFMKFIWCFSDVEISFFSHLGRWLSLISEKKEKEPFQMPKLSQLLPQLALEIHFHPWLVSISGPITLHQSLPLQEWFSSPATGFKWLKHDIWPSWHGYSLQISAIKVGYFKFKYSKPKKDRCLVTYHCFHRFWLSYFFGGYISKTQHVLSLIESSRPPCLSNLIRYCDLLLYRVPTMTHYDPYIQPGRITPAMTHIARCVYIYICRERER